MESRWLSIIDPPAGLNPDTDTTLAVIAEARRRGIVVDIAMIDALFFDSRAMVTATGAHGQTASGALDDYTFIFMRKEPPYDLNFHYATQLLSLATTTVVNNPSALRDYNEKLMTLHFVDFMPPTLVASDPALLAAFVTDHGPCVLKALDSFQGKAVARIDQPGDLLLQQFTDGGRRPVMIQPFLEDVYDGDKRVLLLGERFLGAALRRPKDGYHANFANSEAIACALTAREREIVEQVGPWLVSQGIHFTGLDFIGEKLTEINITCPTGIIQIGALLQRNLVGEVVEYFVELSAGGGVS